MPVWSLSARERGSEFRVRLSLANAEASAVRVDKDRKNHLSSLSFALTEFADWRCHLQSGLWHVSSIYNISMLSIPPGHGIYSCYAKFSQEQRRYLATIDNAEMGFLTSEFINKIPGWILELADNEILMCLPFWYLILPPTEDLMGSSTRSHHFKVLRKIDTNI